MLDKWIASEFLKRAALALPVAVAAHFVAFLASAHAAAAFSWLGSVGLTVTVVVDQSRLAHALTIALFASSQGAQEWVAAKYPAIGKYL